MRGVRARPGALSWCPGWRSWLLGLLSPAGHKKGAAVTAAPVGRTLQEAGELHRLGSLCAAVDFRPRRPRGQARAFRSRGACRGIPGSSPSISVMISPARQSRCHSRAFFLVVWGIGLSPSGLTVLCVLTTKGHQQPDDAGGVGRARGHRAGARSAGGVPARERSGLAHQPARTHPPARRRPTLPDTGRRRRES